MLYFSYIHAPDFMRQKAIMLFVRIYTSFVVYIYVFIYLDLHSEVFE